MDTGVKCKKQELTYNCMMEKEAKGRTFHRITWKGKKEM